MALADGYQVIARRWRPKQFDEIVGQEHIVQTLKNAIEQNRIAHAYLFVGPRGTGKTTTARIFAKALNAEGGPSVQPDDSSSISRAIMGGSCMDVIEIDGASNNGVEDIRSLREECQYAPSEGNFKVYIIDEVHMLSNQAWNALLKTLEEPPPHVKFIFATTEAHKVLATVVSRCQRFEFRPIPNDKIVAKLSAIAGAEDIAAEPAALQSIARMADGGMRDAQSILDQLISFCGNTITEQNVLDVYGLAGEGTIRALTAAMAEGDYQKLLALVEQVADEGRDLYRVLLDLQTFVRETLIDATRNRGESTLTGVPISAESLMRMLDALHQGDDAIRMGLSQRVNFEVTLLKAVEQSRTRAIDTVIKELSQIAAGLPEDAGKKKIKAATAPDAPAPGATEPISPKAAPAPEAQSAAPGSESEPADEKASAADDSPLIVVPDEPLRASNGSSAQVRSQPSEMSAAEGVFPKGSAAYEEALASVSESTREILDDLLRADFQFAMKVQLKREDEPLPIAGGELPQAALAEDLAPDVEEED